MDFGTIVIASAMVVGVWVAYNVAWQAALRNRLRQRLFALRDELFWDAAQGRASFDDHAYGMLRLSMNSVIRNAHVLNFGSLLFYSVCWDKIQKLQKESDPPLHKKIELAVSRLEDKERAELYRTYHRRMLEEIARYVLCWTPLVGVVVCLALVLLPVALVKQAIEKRSQGRMAQLFVDSSEGHCGGLNLA